MTPLRGFLIAVSSDGNTTSWDSISTETELIARTTLTQVEFRGGDTLIFVGSLLGSSDLRQTAALSALTPPERLFTMALAHIDQRLWPEAQALLDRAWSHLPDETSTHTDTPSTEVTEVSIAHPPQDPLPDRPEDPPSDRPEDAPLSSTSSAAQQTTPWTPDAATLDIRTRIRLRQAQVAALQGHQEQAVEALMHASRLHRGRRDFVEGHAHLDGIEPTPWWLMLAEAHGAANHPEAAARAYAQLATVDGDEHRLYQARSLAHAELPEQALEAYNDFITQRQAALDFALVSNLPASLDNGGHDFDRDTDPTSEKNPTLVSAYLEAGALLEALERPEEACARYLALIRKAPFHLSGYQRLFALAASSPPETAFTIAQAATLLRLLRPASAQALETQLGAPLPSPPSPVELPAEYRPMPEALFQQQIIHPGEQRRWSLAKRWLGSWTSSEQIDTTAIEQHCQRIDAQTHPQLKVLLVSIAHLLQLPTPRCYLSHSTTGIRVLGRDNPFILLGRQHTLPDSERQLAGAPLAFAVGSQMAHIRANHLILTNSEFWWSFAGTALDNLVTVVSILPATGLFGKLADGLFNQLKDKVTG
ncbi:MAG: hypothetical protein AAFS10_24865, partial [Myxococcota bacterium]